VRSFFLCIVAALLATVPANAQSGDVVRGVVRGPDGSPLGGQAVVLHRVTGSAGLTVAGDTSAADGSFRLEVADAAADADAVYFLAARFEGELYIGDAFKAPFDSTTQHAVLVGTPETSARNLVTDAAREIMPPAPTPPDPTRWLLWVLPVLALIVLAGTTMIGRARVPDRRRALLAIAQLDEAHAQNAQGADDSAYRARRAELLARVTRSAEG
jgi:hypothetical protein